MLSKRRFHEISQVCFHTELCRCHFKGPLLDVCFSARTPVEQPGTSVDPKTLKTPFTASAQTDGQKQDGLRGRSQHPAEVVNINLGQPSVPFVMSQSCGNCQIVEAITLKSDSCILWNTQTSKNGLTDSRSGLEVDGKTSTQLRFFCQSRRRC